MDSATVHGSTGTIFVSLERAKSRSREAAGEPCPCGFCLPAGAIVELTRNYAALVLGGAGWSERPKRKGEYGRRKAMRHRSYNQGT